MKQQKTDLCFVLAHIKARSVFCYISQTAFSLFAPFLQIDPSGSSPESSWLLLPDPPSSPSNLSEWPLCLDLPSTDELQLFGIALWFLAELDRLSSEIRLAFIADRGARLLLPVSTFYSKFSVFIFMFFYM